MLTLAVIIPCYNEEQVLLATHERLARLLGYLVQVGLVSPASHVLFVDDGSRDHTWAMIEELHARDPRFRGIKLAHNRGHQNALLAGLLTAEGDVLVSMDADLQDDPDVIVEMLRLHGSGNDIVYGVRSDRDADTAFKRLSAEWYYRLLRLLGIEIIFNHADFRLMSRRAIEALREFREVNLFLRGIVPMLGFSSVTVPYTRRARQAGESKYPLRRMLSLAFQGITSFSTAPLRWISLLGVMVSLGSIGVTLWSLYIKLFTYNALPGWASTVVPIYFLGGVQLLCLGIIAEYLAKIFSEIKQRPRYIIEKKLD